MCLTPTYLNLVISVTILLHRPRFKLKDVSPTSRPKCVAAAERILQLMRQYDGIYGVAKTPQTAMMTTYVAGTVFALLCAENEADKSAARSLTAVIGLLTTMNETWASAGKCAAILQSQMVCHGLGIFSRQH